MRTFVHYDEEGEIIAVVKAEVLPEGLKHPFFLEDKRHGAFEVTGGEAVKLDGSTIAKDFRVDLAKRKLVRKSAKKSTAKSTAKKSRRSGTK